MGGRVGLKWWKLGRDGRVGLSGGSEVWMEEGV